MNFDMPPPPPPLVLWLGQVCQKFNIVMMLSGSHELWREYDYGCDHQSQFKCGKLPNTLQHHAMELENWVQGIKLFCGHKDIFLWLHVWIFINFSFFHNFFSLCYKFIYSMNWIYWKLFYISPGTWGWGWRSIKDRVAQGKWNQQNAGASQKSFRAPIETWFFFLLHVVIIRLYQKKFIYKILKSLISVSHSNFIAKEIKIWASPKFEHKIH